MKVEEISEKLSIDKAYVSQLCISLAGAGLLYRIIRGMMSPIAEFNPPPAPTNEFKATDYTKQFVDYIKET